MRKEEAFSLENYVILRKAIKRSESFLARKEAFGVRWHIIAWKANNCFPCRIPSLRGSRFSDFPEMGAACLAFRFRFEIRAVIGS